MNTNQHETVESVESVSETEPLGSLPFSDELYNALHGAGDIGRAHKIAVATVMHDYFNPAARIVTDEVLARYPNYQEGRDLIIGIVTRCLANVPGKAGAALSVWIEDIKPLIAAEMEIANHEEHEEHEGRRA